MIQREREQRGNCSALEVTCHTFLPHSISHADQPCYNVGGDYSKVWIPGSGGSWGAILKLATMHPRWIISLGKQNTAVCCTMRREGDLFLLCFVTEALTSYTISATLVLFIFTQIICHFLRSRHKSMREAGLETNPRGRCYASQNHPSSEHEDLFRLCFSAQLPALSGWVIS